MTGPAYLLRDRDAVLHSQHNYTLRFKELPDYEKPRERLLELGPAYLSMAELVAIVWGTGSPKEDVLAMARRTVKEYGDKALGNEFSAQRLSEALDISVTKAAQLVASFELGRRFAVKQPGRLAQVRNARQAYQYLKDMGQSHKEQLRGLYLNSRYQVIYDEVISVGSLTANIVHPREVFQPAVEHSAIAVLVAHNHPSGRLEPTASDIDITKQLVAAGQLLGIDLLDHLIITAKRYVSVMEETEESINDD
ncbi:MAG TPA: DNA repair protein RadC [Candidatus Saccharimonadales bacterium]|nr:DNA repair protein RadC [Candidatus Saccharimonadales bacterium]